MKKTLFTLFTAAAFIATGCEPAPQGGTDDGAQDVEFSLTASTSDVDLDDSRESATAITFSWTAGSNFGTGNAIEYKWEITAESDADYEDAYVENLGRNITERSFAIGELNNYLRTNLLAMDGAEETYRVRVSAVVAGSDVDQSDEVTFTATTYEPFTGDLYMIGPAAGGWALDTAPKMTLEGSGIFTYTGRLNKGEFRFVTSRADFWPGYVRDASASDYWTLKRFDSEPSSSEDVKFEIGEGGTYKVTANVLTLKVTVEEAAAELPPYEKIWFASKTGSDWTFEEMYQDPTNPFVFRYNGTVSATEFKFGTASGSFSNMYKASTQEECTLDFENSDRIWGTGAALVTGETPDYGWELTSEQSGKPYKIYLDITEGEEAMTIWQFTPYEKLWLVGDATSLGWSLDNIEKSTAQVMTLKDSGNPYVFTWTGTLKTGELKFSCDLKRDWTGYFIKASRPDEPFSNLNGARCILEAGGNDYKWKVTAGGTYTITIDTLNETITIE